MGTQEQEPLVGSEHVPTLPLGLADVQTLEAILKGFVASLRQVPRPTAQHRKQLQVLESIRHRLRMALVSALSGQDMAVPLTKQEFQVIDEALSGFITRVRQRVPLSREREETVLAIEHMRQRIERLHT